MIIGRPPGLQRRVRVSAGTEKDGNGGGRARPRSVRGHDETGIRGGIHDRRQEPLRTPRRVGHPEHDVVTGGRARVPQRAVRNHGLVLQIKLPPKGANARDVPRPDHGRPQARYDHLERVHLVHVGRRAQVHHTPLMLSNGKSLTTCPWTIASVENARSPAEQLTKPFVEDTAIENELRGQHRRRGSVCTSAAPCTARVTIYSERVHVVCFSGEPASTSSFFYCPATARTDADTRADILCVEASFDTSAVKNGRAGPNPDAHTPRACHFPPARFERRSRSTLLKEIFLWQFKITKQTAGVVEKRIPGKGVIGSNRQKDGS
ncbi:hypothetical protein ON010_g8689 [Phytophthora cinnamomi]|nr:hypothetical protein ON010_g8689 [Phytophthora cinnamomi]